jgi:hypothetical protein
MGADGQTDMTKLIVAFPRTCLNISGEKNVLALFYCVFYYAVDQIAFQDILALLLELNEDASCLTCVAVCIGYIIGASISEVLAASICMVILFDYPEVDIMEW